MGATESIEAAMAASRLDTLETLKGASETILKALALKAEVLEVRRPGVSCEVERPAPIIDVAALPQPLAVALLARICEKRDEITAVRRGLPLFMGSD